MSAPGSKPSEKEWTLEGVENAQPRVVGGQLYPPVLEPGERVRVAPVEQLLRCAQALRLIRDSTSGYPANVARRALEEAGIDDPPDGVLGSSGRPEKETG